MVLESVRKLSEIILEILQEVERIEKEHEA